MAVGLVAADHRVTVVLLDGAVLGATRLRPELVGAEPLERALVTLLEMGHRVLVERESAERFGLAPARLLPGVEMVEQTALPSALLAADFCLHYS